MYQITCGVKIIKYFYLETKRSLFVIQLPADFSIQTHILQLISNLKREKI